MNNRSMRIWIAVCVLAATLLLGAIGCSPMMYIEVANKTDRELQNVGLEVEGSFAPGLPGGVFAVGARKSSYTRRPTGTVFSLSWDGTDGARRGVLVPRREVLPAGFNWLTFLILSDSTVEVRALTFDEYMAFRKPPWPRAGRTYPATDIVPTTKPTDAP